MTAQLSRERLEEIASLPLKTTSCGFQHAPGAYSTVYSHEIVEMARMLLAGMGSDPVYQMRLLDGTEEETIWVEVSKEEFNTPLKNPNEWQKRILYSAPPAPEKEV